MKHIVFTRDVRTELHDKLNGVDSADIFILVDNNSRNFCLDHLALGKIPVEHTITIAEGEHDKSLESVMEVWQVLSQRGARRNSVLLNVGGGLISDIGGFAASCFKRGIRYINIPTTLLAQVDASVGGKNGVNFNGLKNEIGIFSNPDWVMIDNYFLQFLTQRQVLSGFAEMLKHALLSSEKHLAEIMQVDLSQVAEENFLQLIRESVAVKSAVVESDPQEKGLRKALNFGHTVAHAIESVAIRKNLEIYHGDAVAYGMIVELYLSVRKLGFDRKHFEAVKKFILEKYPPYHPVDEADVLYELMLHDKKNEHDGVNFTLLREPGEFEIDHYCDHNEIIEALGQLN
ncbi:MAG: 3-dehydroquinate synthase [Odoribacter sp.]